MNNNLDKHFFREENIISQIDNAEKLNLITLKNGENVLSFQAPGKTQNTTKMVITNAGNVGIGTSTPSEKLEVNGNAIVEDITANGNLSIAAISYTINENTDNVAIIEIDASNKTMVNINNNGIPQTINGFTSGTLGQQITVINNGGGVKTIAHNIGTQKILLPNNTNINLSLYQSATFLYDGSEWYCISLNN